VNNLRQTAGLYLTLAALLLPLSLSAQITFMRTYGGTNTDNGYSVEQTPDGGYIIAGTTNSFGAGAKDIWLIKTDAHGDCIWSRTYGGASDDEGYSIRQTGDGGFAMAGHTSSFGPDGFGVWLIKTDADGDTTWTRTFGGELGNSVLQDADGGYVVAGRTSTSECDVLLIRTDASGGLSWTKSYGHEEWDEGCSVLQTEESSYVVAGYSHLSGSPRTNDVWLLKTDVDGDTVWTRSYGGWFTERGYSVQQTTDDCYIIAGETYSFGAGVSDVWLIKTSSTGNTVWTQTFGGTGYDGGCFVQQTTDGGYVIAGTTTSYGAGGGDVWLIKTDSEGDTIWTRTYGGARDEMARALQKTADGGYVVVAWTSSYGAGSNDVWLIKTDSLGNVGVAEPPERTPLPSARATIIGAAYRYSGMCPAELVDATGRRVMALVPGTNDLSSLPAGVYSVISPSSAPVRVLKPK